jgi:hypothetical protein
MEVVSIWRTSSGTPILHLVNKYMCTVDIYQQLLDAAYSQNGAQHALLWSTQMYIVYTKLGATTLSLTQQPHVHVFVYSAVALLCFMVRARFSQLLLQKGAIVQSRGRCGMTPLHEAAGSGKSNVSSSCYYLLAFTLLV